MLVKLLQALYVDGKLYPVGIHDLSEEKLKHKHFHKYIKLGYVVEADHAEAIKPESPQERGARLAEKLHKAPKVKSEAAPAEEIADEELPSGEPSFGDEEAAPAEDDESEQKESPKKKHKNKR